MKRSPLRRVSKKRQSEQRRRAASLRAAYPVPPLCTVWERRLAAGLLPLAVCTGLGDDAHEVLTRARGGSITDLDNIVTPCRPCHDVLTFTPTSELAWAYDLGLLAHSKGE